MLSTTGIVHNRKRLQHFLSYPNKVAFLPRQHGTICIPRYSNVQKSLSRRLYPHKPIFLSRRFRSAQNTRYRKISGTPRDFLRALAVFPLGLIARRLNHGKTSDAGRLDRTREPIVSIRLRRRVSAGRLRTGHHVHLLVADIHGDAHGTSGPITCRPHTHYTQTFVNVQVGETNGNR